MASTLLILLMSFLLLNACLAWLWYSLRTSKVMFEYHTGWGVAGVVGLLFGLHLILALFFILSYELEDEEDVGFFKKLFISFVFVLIFGVGLAVAVTVSEDNPTGHDEVATSSLPASDDKPETLRESPLSSAHPKSSSNSK